APDLTPRTSPRAEQRCFTRPSPSTSLGRGKWLRLPDQNWLCIPDRYHSLNVPMNSDFLGYLNFVETRATASLFPEFLGVFYSY
ncbi:MAG: hypothetical protein ACXWN0_11425, partial [Isosphaeraceae bacterium]